MRVLIIDSATMRNIPSRLQEQICNFTATLPSVLGSYTEQEIVLPREVVDPYGEDTKSVI